VKLHFTGNEQPRRHIEFGVTILPDGRWLLYDRESNTATTLEAPSGIFWELCDGQTTLTEIISEIHSYYPDIDVETLEAQSWELLSALIDQGLVSL